MTDSSLKPMSCLSHGLASFGEQSQAVCLTKFKDSAAGDTYASSLMQIREEEDQRRDGGQVRTVPHPHPHTKASTSQGKSGGGKQVPRNPNEGFECLEKVSRGKSVVNEPEFLSDSDEDDSESEGTLILRCSVVPTCLMRIR